MEIWAILPDWVFSTRAPHDGCWPLTIDLNNKFNSQGEHQPKTGTKSSVKINKNENQ